MTPCIICVAITGSLPTKANNPAVPITISEQIESTHAAFEAGASIAHCHVRDDQGLPSSDPDRFARLKAGLEQHCPGMIVQLSTGGRSGAGQARGGMLPLRPDMASLSVGSNNFPTRVYENPPDLVDWLATVKRLFGPDAPWCAAGIGPAQIVLNEWAIAAGGHARTGLEDNVRLDRDRLAPSNAALVQRVVDLCDRASRPVATWQQSRKLLGLPMPQLR